MAGTNPSVAPLSGSGSNHEIAFQADPFRTRADDLWDGTFGNLARADAAMASGTSPSISDPGDAAVQLENGNVGISPDLGIDDVIDTGGADDAGHEPEHRRQR